MVRQASGDDAHHHARCSAYRVWLAVCLRSLELLIGAYRSARDGRMALRRWSAEPGFVRLG